MDVVSAVPRYINNVRDFAHKIAQLPLPERPESIPFKDWYDLSLNPLTPIIFATAYIAIVSHFNARNRVNPVNRITAKPFQYLVIAHNLFLAVFSAYTFVNVAPVVAKSFWGGYSNNGLPGFAHAFCDSDTALWNHRLARFGYMFYLSKFYEVVDTAIILAKGKRAAFLQEYHHAGAMLTMWAALRFQSTPIWAWLCFNSFIHTIMYSYYFCSTVRLPFPLVLKRSLTRMQITQFVVGGSLASSYLFVNLPSLPSVPADSLPRIGECLPTDGMRFAVWLNVVYLTPLTYLFVDFFRKSYRNATKVHAKKMN